jgi:chromosome segregation and condensation protein ScpB
MTLYIQLFNNIDAYNMAQAQMSLGLEQKYAQRLLQLAEDKSKCKIWTRSKYDEIVDLMTKETCKEDKTPA